MNGGYWRIVALIAGATAAFLVGYLILDLIFGRTPMQRRISALRVFSVGTPPVQEPLKKVLLNMGGRTIARSEVLAGFALKSEPLIDRSSASVTPNEWLAVRMVAALGGALLFTVILPWWIGIWFGGAFGFVITNVLLKVRISRRERTFADELPNTLQLVLSSLRSGFTLQQSIEAAVTDDDGPVADELRRALSESRINGEFEDALARVGERVNSQEMIWLVMAIRLQREVGGSLADVMQTTADTMRERAYLRRHVNSLSAEGRFSAYILVAMPVGIGVLLYITRPEYVGVLFKEPLGIGMIMAALILMAIGGFWLKASVKIDV